MKDRIRYASHYICFQEKELSAEILAVIRRDERHLISAPLSVLRSFPEGTRGFASCGVEFNAENKLIRLFPFTQELASTIWKPGTLNLSDLLKQVGTSFF